MSAVELELVKLKHTWQREIRQQPKASTYVFLGHKHETQLFETLFKKQISDQSDTEDVYMIHYQIFENKKTFGASLVNEWLEVFEEWKVYEGLDIDWEVDQQFLNQYPTDAVLIVRAFNFLFNQFPFLKNNLIFLHLAPFQISSSKDYQEWLIDCGRELEKNGLNQNIKLVISDHIDYRVVEKSYKPHSFSMPININQLMSNTLESTSTLKDNKKHNFQHYLLKASNYITQQNFRLAESAAERALALSIAEKSPEQIVASYNLQAQIYFNQLKFDRAKQCYQLALENSKGNDELEIQMRFHLVSFYISQKNKEKANEQLQSIIEIGERLEDKPLLIQAYRLIAQLEETTKNYELALDNYEKAIELCKAYPKEEQLEQNIHYIAHCLISCPKSGSVGIENENYMVSAFGKNWRDEIILPKEGTVDEDKSIKIS